MKKIKFSIPYNGDLNLMKWAINSRQVAEVYFAGPSGFDFSDPYQDLQPHSSRDIFSLIKLCNRNKIKANLLINKRILFFENISKIVNNISLLEQRGKIDTITVSDCFIVPFLKNRFPRIKLQSSIFMGIDNVFKVREAFKMGITEFCLDPSINRNADELKRIGQFNQRHPQIVVKLLGALGCYQNCFYSWRHADLPILHDILMASGLNDKENVLGANIDFDKCFFKIRDISDEIKRPFIRPEDVFYYEKNNLADYIKIAYRNDSSELLRQKLLAYFERSYDGNLFKLFYSNKHSKIYCENKKIPLGFISKVMNCDKDCETCGYCDTVSKNCVKIKSQS